MSYSYIFPYGQVPKGSSIVIYGAGMVGRDYLAQAQQDSNYTILYIVDKNYKEIKELHGVEVCDPQRLYKTEDYDYIIVASYTFVDSILHNLWKMDIHESKIVSNVRFGEQHYASCAEDVVVRTIFKFLGKDTFSYIDIGANDPYISSNTAYLYTIGCRGICVEPNPDLIDMLKENRPDDVVLNIGIATKAGVLSYYMFENNIYNTFSESAADFREKSKIKLVNVIKVPVKTLVQIIDEYSGGICPEFLQIDIEGYDYDVLRSFDFAKSSPVVICVEAGDWNRKEMSEMLDSKDFFPFHKTVANTIYLRKNVKEQYPSIIDLANREV